MQRRSQSLAASDWLRLAHKQQYALARPTFHCARRTQSAPQTGAPARRKGTHRPPSAALKWPRRRSLSRLYLVAWAVLPESPCQDCLALAALPVATLSRQHGGPTLHGKSFPHQLAGAKLIRPRFYIWPWASASLGRLAKCRWRPRRPQTGCGRASCAL